MKEIILKRQESYLLDNKFFMVKSGKIILRNILENGKVVTNEGCFLKGEIIGNFFNFLDIKNLSIPEVEIEVEALEDNTVLEEIKIDRMKVKENYFIKKLLDSIIKKILLDFYFQVYDLKGYMLSLLKLYIDKENKVLKKNIKPENFNMSKSHFYLMLSKIKTENFIIEKGKYIILDLNKVNEYLVEIDDKKN